MKARIGRSLGAGVPSLGKGASRPLRSRGPRCRGIAKALGQGQFAVEDLYRPSVAVEFGSWYLANQMSSFGSDTFQGLAAYNAGASPLRRWAVPDPDLFVERIDYSETRSYVRQIYLHHAIYRGLTREQSPAEQLGPG